MITDSWTIPDNTELKCDLCVVGARAAGITLALQFVQSKHSVIVLESGGERLNTQQQTLNHGDVLDGVPPPNKPVPAQASWRLNSILGRSVCAAGRAGFSEASACSVKRMAYRSVCPPTLLRTRSTFARSGSVRLLLRDGFAALRRIDRGLSRS